MSSRYEVQKRLPQVGQAGQDRLQQATVVVVGAGGLGCAVLPILAGAGVGRLHIIDPDEIEVSNLHRQTLYAMHEVGQAKAEVACAKLQALNPLVEVQGIKAALDPSNVAEWVQRADVVVDAADQFCVSYTLSDACMAANAPLVSASAQAMEGYVGVFCCGAPSYRAVFPQWPTRAVDCAAAGVLGSVVALVGAAQAQCVLSLLLGLSPRPQGTLWRWDGLTMRSSIFDFSGAQEPDRYWPLVGPSQLLASDVVVDLRSQQEAPQLPCAAALRCEVPGLEALSADFSHSDRIVLACRSGIRAAAGAAILERAGFDNIALLAMGNG